MDFKNGHTSVPSQLMRDALSRPMSFCTVIIHSLGYFWWITKFGKQPGITHDLELF
jgi:hypothetical protein